MASFKKVNDGEADVVARSVVLRTRISEADDENVGRCAASGAITAPAAEGHLLGVARSLGRSAGLFAFAAVGRIALRSGVFN